MTAQERKALLDKAAFDVFAVECEWLELKFKEDMDEMRKRFEPSYWERFIEERHRAIIKETSTDES